MENETTKLLIIGGPDRFDMARALVGESNELLRFESENYDYLLDATITLFEKRGNDQIYLKGTLQHANNNIVPTTAGNAKYNFTGVYSMREQSGTFFVENLSGDGLREIVAPLNVEKTMVTDTINQVETLRQNLKHIADDLKSQKLSALLPQAAILNQQVRLIEGAVNNLGPVHRVLTDFVERM